MRHAQRWPSWRRRWQVCSRADDPSMHDGDAAIIAADFGPECPDSPTGKHEIAPDRWHDTLCIWCIEETTDKPSLFVLEDEPRITECGVCGRAIDPDQDADGVCDDEECRTDPDVTGVSRDEAAAEEWSEFLDWQRSLGAVN